MQRSLEDYLSEHIFLVILKLITHVRKILIHLDNLHSIDY